jgi:hypothetical protein
MGNLINMIKNIYLISSNHKKIVAGSIMTLIMLISIPWTVIACNGKKQTLSTSTGENMNFRFEDYEKEEDGKKRLLELFPIGSDINKFANTMKSIKGVDCIPVYKGDIYCTYVVPISKDVAYGWYVSVSGKADKITDIYTRKNYGAYYPPGTPPIGLPIRK